MSAADIFALIYFAGAAVIAVITWIENGRVYYVNGPPSGCLSGLFWPLILVVAGLAWLYSMRPEPDQ